tara:strand:- start:121 stop:717 length:597 start_codon:yes stop_codon:yes gene_type:complete
MQINDGTGTGAAAKVAGSGRVAVDADDGVLAAAKAGGLYVLTNHSDHPTLTATATGGLIALLVNSENSRKSFVIDSITVASSLVALSVSVEINYEIGNPGNIEGSSPVDIPPTNTAYSSSSGEGYVWDEASNGITNVTDGTGILRTILAAGGPTELVPSGRIIVAPGGSIGISHDAPGTTPEISFAIRFYEVDAATGY